MDKRLIFPGNGEKQRDLFFVKEDRNYLRKHGGSYHPDVMEFINKAKPMPNLVQVLLTALGAYEYWGQNVNGDRFREGPLSHKGRDYGYETFKTDANYFTHHVNKDPALAKGKVLHSVWNEKSKRVELIVGIDINLDPEAITSIDRGENLSFSMGARVPYDVCSICANKAKTRAEYCEHLKYMMNRMDPVSGQLVGADNTLPRFFDISRVLIPADKTAYMWSKIASAENPYRNLSSAYLAELPPGKLNDLKYLQEKVAEQRDATPTKSASVSKRAEIQKRIPAQFEKKTLDALEKTLPPVHALLQETSPDLPPEVLARLKQLAPGIGDLLSTMIGMGIQPKDHELTALVGSEQIPESMPASFSPSVVEELLPFLASRSFARPILGRRLILLAEKLENGDPVLEKKANSIAEILGAASKDPHSADLLTKVIGHVASNPLLYAAIAAILIPSLKAMGGKSTSGYYDVDEHKRALYNNNWQSYFAEQQARPVTVIKTGSAVDTGLAKKVFYGVPAIFAASHAARIKRSINDAQGQRTGHITDFVADHPDLVTGGMFAEHYTGKHISSRVAKAIDSGKRLFKKASLQDIDFLNSIPEEDQPLFWDLAILGSAERIAKKLGG